MGPLSVTISDVRHVCGERRRGPISTFKLQHFLLVRVSQNDHNYISLIMVIYELDRWVKFIFFIFEFLGTDIRSTEFNQK